MNKNLVRTILVTLVMVIILSSTTVFAEEQAIHIYVDGERVEFLEGFGNPFIDDQSRTMIPLTAVSNSLNYETAWDGENYSAIVRGNGVEVILPINKSYGFVDEVREEFDTTTIIIDGRTYVPLRFLSNSLKMNVDWEFGRDVRADNKIAHIIDLSLKLEIGQANILNEELDLRNSEFTSMLEEFGEIQDTAGQGGNFTVGPYGFSYDDENIDLGFNNFGMTIPNERTPDLLEANEIVFNFGYFSDTEFNLFANSLKYLFSEKDYDDIDSIATKVKSDIESTIVAKGYATSRLDGNSFAIGDFNVRYFQNSTYFYVYVGY